MFRWKVTLSLHGGVFRFEDLLAFKKILKNTFSQKKLHSKNKYRNLFKTLFYSQNLKQQKELHVQHKNLWRKENEDIYKQIFPATLSKYFVFDNIKIDLTRDNAIVSQLSNVVPMLLVCLILSAPSLWNRDRFLIVFIVVIIGSFKSNFDPFKFN